MPDLFRCGSLTLVLLKSLQETGSLIHFDRLLVARVSLLYVRVTKHHKLLDHDLGLILNVRLGFFTLLLLFPLKLPDPVHMLNPLVQRV